MSEQSGDILITRSGAAQIIRLNRPHKKNALTGPMYQAMCEALEAGDKDPVIATHVFLGVPGIFSAGNDIGEFLASAMGDNAVTKAVLRLIPLPRENRLMLVPFRNARKACEAVSAVFRAGITPSAMTLIRFSAPPENML